jgi:hypothetical protein
MNTGVTSVANLPDLAAIYPFAGYEWLFALIAFAFTAYFVMSQIRMESMDIHKELDAPRAEVAMAPAE